MAFGAITIGGGFNQAQQAAQLQQCILDQQRLQVLAGVKNGTINQAEFMDLAGTLSMPRDSGPAPTTQPTTVDPAQGQQISNQLRDQRQPYFGTGFANQAAQLQQVMQDQVQAQSIYQQISTRSTQFKSLYDKYSTGDFQPQANLDPQNSARYQQVFAQIQSGQMKPEQALGMMR